MVRYEECADYSSDDSSGSNSSQNETDGDEHAEAVAAQASGDEAVAVRTRGKAPVENGGTKAKAA